MRGCTPAAGNQPLGIPIPWLWSLLRRARLLGTIRPECYLNLQTLRFGFPKLVSQELKRCARIPWVRWNSLQQERPDSKQQHISAEQIRRKMTWFERTRLYLSFKWRVNPKEKFNWLSSSKQSAFLSSEEGSLPTKRSRSETKNRI